MLPLAPQCWVSTTIAGVLLLVVAFAMLFFFNVYLGPELGGPIKGQSEQGLSGTGMCFLDVALPTIGVWHVERRYNCFASHAQWEAISIGP